MKLLKACKSILRIKFISLLQFRAATWARITTNIFYGFVHVVLLLIFYKYGVNSSAGSDAGMSAAQAVSYTWLVQIIASIFPAMGSDSEIGAKIINGDVGIELCRPLDLYAHWFSRAMATKLAPFLLSLAPLTVVALLLPAPYNLQAPASVAGFLAMLLCLCTGLLLSCAVISLSYGLLLNLHWGNGPINMMMLITDVLSGSYLPLQLWPAWAQKFLYLQPFAGLADIPLRLYVGTMAPGLVWQAVAVQLVWVLVFVAAGRALMNRSLQKVVIQGG
jgi:ABC-2 type transport system permease protein